MNYFAELTKWLESQRDFEIDVILAKVWPILEKKPAYRPYLDVDWRADAGDELKQLGSDMLAALAAALSK